MVGGVSEVDADYVSFSGYALELFGDCQWGFMLRNVFGYKCCANPKFQWVANLIVVGDAHLAPLPYESLVEKVVPSFFFCEVDEGEVCLTSSLVSGRWLSKYSTCLAL